MKLAPAHADPIATDETMANNDSELWLLTTVPGTDLPVWSHDWFETNGSAIEACWLAPTS